jgi:predicted TPR repeat methyltransferase
VFLSNEWDEYAGEWDSDEDVLLYSEKAFRSLGDHVALDNLNVLDFGCGTGCLTEKLANPAKRVVGLDTSPAMLAVLEGKRLANVLTVGDELTSKLVATHPYLQAKFDLISASSVCGFLPDYEGALLLLKSLLAPGGLFVQWDWLASEPDSDDGLTEDRVCDALNGSGFDSVSVSVPFSLASSQGRLDVLMGMDRNV